MPVAYSRALVREQDEKGRSGEEGDGHDHKGPVQVSSVESEDNARLPDDAQSGGPLGPPFGNVPTPVCHARILRRHHL